MPAAVASAPAGWAFRLVRDAPGLSANARLAGFVLATYRSAASGLAWPKVATLAEGTGLARRTVQRALRELEAAGVVRLVEREPGRYGRRGYQFAEPPPAVAGINDNAAEGRQTAASEGRHSDAPSDPANAAEGCHTGALGASQRRPRGVTLAPPSEQEKEQELEAKGLAPLPARPRAGAGGRTRTRKADPYPRPDGVEPQAWADFLTNRRRKKMANTPSAHKRLLDDLARLATDDWPPGRLVAYAAGKGWGGIYAPDESEEPHGNPRHHSDKSTGAAARAARATLIGAGAP